MRDNWLSNRVFRSYDDILEHCCFAWNKLVDQPWAIMSIGLHDRAHWYDTRSQLILAQSCRHLTVPQFVADRTSDIRGLFYKKIHDAHVARGRPEPHQRNP